MKTALSTTTALLLILLLTACPTVSESPTPDAGNERDTSVDEDKDATGDDADSGPTSDADASPADTGDTDSDTDTEDATPLEPDFEVGDPATGSDQLALYRADEEAGDLEPLSHGDTLTWEQGMQGGFHIWSGFRADGPDFDDLSSQDLDEIEQSYDLYHVDGERVAHTNRYGFATELDDGIEAGPFMVILRRSTDPNDTTDDLHQLVLSVELPDGQEFESKVWIYLDCCDTF